LRIQGNGTEGFGVEVALPGTPQAVVDAVLPVHGVAGDGIEEVILFVSSSVGIAGIFI